MDPAWIETIISREQNAGILKGTDVERRRIELATFSVRHVDMLQRQLSSKQDIEKQRHNIVDQEMKYGLIEGDLDHIDKRKSELAKAAPKAIDDLDFRYQVVSQLFPLPKDKAKLEATQDQAKRHLALSTDSLVTLRAMVNNEPNAENLLVDFVGKKVKLFNQTVKSAPDPQKKEELKERYRLLKDMLVRYRSAPTDSLATFYFYFLDLNWPIESVRSSYKRYLEKYTLEPSLYTNENATLNGYKKDLEEAISR